MTRLPVLDEDDFPEATRPLLDEVRRDFGFVPNLERVLAAAPAALEGYVRLWDLVGATGFSPLEQQVVCQEINRLHSCHYCLAHHDVLLARAGAGEGSRTALIEGLPDEDERLNVLREMVQEMVQARGYVSEDSVKRFIAAGFEAPRLLDLVMILACKVISNYTNHLADTPLEAFVQPVSGDR